MKRTLLTLAIALVAIVANAQFRWGATAGVDITTLKFSQDLFAIDNSVGYSAGVKGEMMFPGIGFGIEFGLLYEQRGATLNLGERPIWSTQGFGRERCYLHYIDIPLNLKFKWTRMDGLEDYFAPFVQGGPILSILAGHNKNTALNYADAEIGLTAGVGFELFKHWQIAGFYTWGMTYAVKTRQLTDFTGDNRTWDIRLTYFF